LPLVFNAHAKRSLETLCRFDNSLGKLAPNNALLRCMPHLELTATNFYSGDNFEISYWNEVSDFQLALSHDCQGRRLHSPNPDDAPRALTQDDGSSSGQ